MLKINRKIKRLSSILFYALSCAAMILFTFTLNTQIWFIFITSFLLGFFMTAYLLIGYELVVELTYPEPGFYFIFL